MAELNLVPAIRAIKDQIREKTSQFQVEIKPLEESLEALRRINTACERCDGKGLLLRYRSCAEDDVDPNDPRDWYTCPECRGTGKVKKEG